MRPQAPQVYGVYELEQLQPFLDDLYDACEVQGLPVRTAISEYAPGQVELTLEHHSAPGQSDSPWTIGVALDTLVGDWLVGQSRRQAVGQAKPHKAQPRQRIARPINLGCVRGTDRHPEVSHILGGFFQRGRICIAGRKGRSESQIGRASCRERVSSPV